MIPQTDVDRRWALGLAALLAVLYAAWIIQAGVRFSPDSMTYSRWADLLIAHRFNIATYLNEQSFVVPPALYLLWVVLLASLKVSFGSHWASGVVALNWLAVSAGTYLTLRTVQRLTASRPATLWAAASLAVATDLLIFLPFVLSDLLFWGASTAVLALGLEAALAQGQKAPRREVIRRTLLGSSLVVIALAFRPTATPLAIYWVLAVMPIWGGSRVASRMSAIVAGAIVAIIAAVVSHAYFMMHPAAFPFSPAAGMISRLSAEYQAGVLVYAPGRNIYVSPAVDLAGALRMTLQRFLYFFSPWLSGYSVAHVVLNAVFFVPAYGLSILAVARARAAAPSTRLAVLLLVLYIGAVSVFHATMQIDFDNRYRLPVLPALLILGGIGIQALVARHGSGSNTYKWFMP